MGDAENLHQGKTELCPGSHSWCRVECGCGSMSIPNPQHSVLTLSCTPSQPGFLLGGEWWVHPSPPEHPPSLFRRRGTRLFPHHIYGREECDFVLIPGLCSAKPVPRREGQSGWEPGPAPFPFHRGQCPPSGVHLPGRWTQPTSVLDSTYLSLNLSSDASYLGDLNSPSWKWEEQECLTRRIL